MSLQTGEEGGGDDVAMMKRLFFQKIERQCYMKYFYELSADFLVPFGVPRLCGMLLASCVCPSTQASLHSLRRERKSRKNSFEDGVAKWGGGGGAYV